MNCLAHRADKPHAEAATDAFGVAIPVENLTAALDYSNCHELTQNLPECDLATVHMPTPAGPREVQVVTEAGFYRLIAQRQPWTIPDAAVRAIVQRFQTALYASSRPKRRRTRPSRTALRETITAPALTRSELAVFYRGMDQQRLRDADRDVLPGANPGWARPATVSRYQFHFTRSTWNGAGGGSCGLDMHLNNVQKTNPASIVEPLSERTLRP